MPPLPLAGVVAGRRGVDEGHALVAAQTLGGDPADVRRIARHVDRLALRGLEAGEHHLAETARDLRRSLPQQLAEHAGRCELCRGGPHLQQVGAHGVEVVEAVGELHSGVGLAGGEDVDLPRQLAGVAGQHDEAGNTLDLALGEADRLAPRQARRDPRVGGDVEAGEDPATDDVEPGLLVVAADGQHESAVEHWHAGDLLRRPQHQAAAGVGLAVGRHHHRVRGHAEEGLGVRVEERRGGRARVSGVAFGDGLVGCVAAAGQLAEVAGHIVLTADPARTRGLAQLVDGPLEARQPPGDVGVGVGAGVRRGRDQGRGPRVVGADRAVVVAGRHAQDQGDDGGYGEESS